MQDTPQKIYDKQREIFLSKSSEERLMMCFDMMETGRNMLEYFIKNNNPDIAPLDLKIEVFKQLYKNDFSEKELTNVIDFFKINAVK